jgi:hypothetical protein
MESLSKMKSPWNYFERFATWLRRKQLERELRCSQKFQSRCQRIQCFILAELEESYQSELREKIRRLKLKV